MMEDSLQRRRGFAIAHFRRRTTSQHVLLFKLLACVKKREAYLFQHAQDGSPGIINRVTLGSLQVIAQVVHQLLVQVVLHLVGVIHQLGISSEFFKRY